MARIRADVYELERIARWLRAKSTELTNKHEKVRASVNDLVWEGKAYNYFIEKYRPAESGAISLASSMVSMATTLESIAEAMRQADLEAARREEEARRVEAARRAVAQSQNSGAKK